MEWTISDAIAAISVCFAAWAIFKSHQSNIKADRANEIANAANNIAQEANDLTRDGSRSLIISEYKNKVNDVLIKATLCRERATSYCNRVVFYCELMQTMSKYSDTQGSLDRAIDSVTKLKDHAGHIDSAISKLKDVDYEAIYENERLKSALDTLIENSNTDLAALEERINVVNTLGDEAAAEYDRRRAQS